ncbi:MAG: outer membrane beta-barrel protein [Nevskia sp.]|nr:outer membrane beta-barrel protein [Nevskia sp.]
MKLVTVSSNVLALSIFGIAVAGAPAFAGDEMGLYVGGGVGVGRPLAVGDNKLGVLPMLSVGYTLANGLRPEAEFSYRYNSKNGFAEHAASAMGNLWYDFWQDGYYFYAGGGFGATDLHANSGGVSGSDTLPAWQVGFGFGNALTRHLTLGLDFRHLATLDKPKFTIQGQSVESPHYMTNAALIELRYSFGGRLPDPVFGSETPVQVVPIR